MNTNSISSSLNNTSSAYTIPKEETKILVLTLRGEKAKKDNDIKEKEEKCYESSIGKSNISIEIVEKSLNHLQISPTSSEDDEREYTHLADVQDLSLLKQDNAITTNQLIAAETHIEEVETLQNQISTFDLISAHFNNFINLHGTTFVTTATTVGVGVTTVATGGLGNLLLGGGALAISAYEFTKMVKKYLNDKGSSDHLKAIETTLTNIENKRKIASALIKDAKELNQTIDHGLIDIDIKIGFLAHQLRNSSGKLHEIISIALENAKITKQRLEIQTETIKDAIKNSSLANVVINQQQRLIESLLNNVVGDDIDESNIKNIIEQVKKELIEIQAKSSKAYDYQTNANSSMLKALKITQEVIGLEDQQIKLILEIQLIEEELKNAQNQCYEIQNQLNDVKEENGALKENLEAQQQNNKEMKNDIQIGNDALEAEKNVLKLGEGSVILGNTTAVGSMMGIGFLTFGPPGAIIGALAGSVFVSHPAAVIAHYARKSFKAHDAVKLEMAFQLCANSFAEGKFDVSKPIIIKPEFTYNNAPLFGAGLYKNPYNLIVSGLNLICTEQTPLWKSKRAGTLYCQIGGITLPEIKFYGHTAYNETYAKYGAISIDDQLQLCALLTIALEKDQVCPQALLKFLYLMQCVDVEGIKIMMISPDSKVMEPLRIKCVDKQLFPIEKK